MVAKVVALRAAKVDKSRREPESKSEGRTRERESKAQSDALDKHSRYLSREAQQRGCERSRIEPPSPPKHADGDGGEHKDQKEAELPREHKKKNLERGEPHLLRSITVGVKKLSIADRLTEPRRDRLGGVTGKERTREWLGHFVF